MISSRGVVIAHDNNRVNSNNTKMKPDDHFFHNFIVHTLQDLESGKKVLLFNQDQINYIKNVMNISLRYIEKYNWWEAYKI